MKALSAGEMFNARQVFLNRGVLAKSARLEILAVGSTDGARRVLEQGRSHSGNPLAAVPLRCNVPGRSSRR